MADVVQVRPHSRGYDVQMGGLSVRVDVVHENQLGAASQSGFDVVQLTWKGEVRSESLFQTQNHQSNLIRVMLCRDCFDVVQIECGLTSCPISATTPIDWSESRVDVGQIIS
jgi:hypothetical protein